MGPFFKDLKNPAYTTPFAIYHRRFSTNTVPKWPLAQPMRVLGHNGEHERHTPPAEGSGWGQRGLRRQPRACWGNTANAAGSLLPARCGGEGGEGGEGGVCVCLHAPLACWPRKLCCR